MTDKTRAAIQQAMEALKKYHYAAIDAGFSNQQMLNQGFTAFELLREALDKPVSQERYFCQRCGKRVGDENGVWDGIHTCTPPESIPNQYQNRPITR